MNLTTGFDKVRLKKKSVLLVSFNEAMYAMFTLLHKSFFCSELPEFQKLLQVFPLSRSLKRRIFQTKLHTRIYKMVSLIHIVKGTYHGQKSC